MPMPGDADPDPERDAAIVAGGRGGSADGPHNVVAFAGLTQLDPVLILPTSAQ
jgi:hypothetical protein